MQSFFVFGGGGAIAKFKSKLSLRWSMWFENESFLKKVTIDFGIFKLNKNGK